ncbi:muconolactone delta-isomerase [Mycobacterium kansasii]|uniref:Muconolactone Delta-isomerase n=1 Tax=Mycobacterium attenuatum TaxID=2341086 RepID=A0A498PQH6_9MYCO|nr:muconolactone Delta-isomerase family protein [Mycobacterium attenuatum]ORB85161.1 muconolactone delta-isomerase [Mycobacterium kansasii]VBA33349.1 Muconolactone Delta-isomerase [Mycobacterium attenuatum]VBA45578.1 Muconolactone Delta-isomerase [Mycobacterium attenuatum]VBA46969.1 Muconolactone Delta-isomerase [Mycobacterium attenuatum]
MEFLVAMTTCVPDGTSLDRVNDVRAREAAHSRELAAQGSLLRLWRPPLRPGEWRTLGLFAAADDERLEQLLASMPLWIWRTDEVTALYGHPDDPPAAGITPRPGKGPEFLIAMTLTVPPGTAAQVVDDAAARQARRARDLAEGGHLVRLWTLPDGPDGPRMVGLWRARDPGELMAILESLPLSGWMTIETTPLSPHPNDPIRSR